jgi:hypothetical protein
LVASGSLVLMPFLRASAKWVGRVELSYREAYTTLLFTGIVLTPLIYVGARSVSSVGTTKEALVTMSLFVTIVGFFVQSAMLSGRLEVSGGKAMLISLTMIGTVVALGLGATAMLLSLP